MRKPSIFRRVRQDAESSARAHTNWRRNAELLLLVCGVASAVSIAAIVPSWIELLEIPRSLWASHVGVLTIAIAGTIVALPSTIVPVLAGIRRLRADVSDPTETFFQLDTLKREGAVISETLYQLRAWDQLQIDVCALARLVATRTDELIAASRRAGDDTGELRRAVSDEFAGALDSVLDRLEAGRGTLMGYRDVAETYFIDIFEVRSDSRLHLVSRRKTPSAIEHRRSWALGDGHVGDAVRRRKPILVDYHVMSRDDGTAQSFPTDRDYFGCRITAPILARTPRRGVPYGALVVTSSDHERLNEDHLAGLEILSWALAEMFASRERALRRVDEMARKDGSGRTRPRDGALPADRGVLASAGRASVVSLGAGEKGDVA